MVAEFSFPPLPAAIITRRRATATARSPGPRPVWRRPEKLVGLGGRGLSLGDLSRRPTSTPTRRAPNKSNRRRPRRTRLTARPGFKGSASYLSLSFYSLQRPFKKQQALRAQRCRRPCLTPRLFDAGPLIAAIETVHVIRSRGREKQGKKRKRRGGTTTRYRHRRGRQQRRTPSESTRSAAHNTTIKTHRGRRQGEKNLAAASP